MVSDGFLRRVLEELAIRARTRCRNQSCPTGRPWAAFRPRAAASIRSYQIGIQVTKLKVHQGFLRAPVTFESLYGSGLSRTVIEGFVGMRGRDVCFCAR